MTTLTMSTRQTMDPRPVTDSVPKISVRNLDFFYGKFHALKNINLKIPQNKVTAFIGPSGLSLIHI